MPGHITTCTGRLHQGTALILPLILSGLCNAKGRLRLQLPSSACSECSQKQLWEALSKFRVLHFKRMLIRAHHDLVSVLVGIMAVNHHHYFKRVSIDPRLCELLLHLRVSSAYRLSVDSILATVIL